MSLNTINGHSENILAHTGINFYFKHLSAMPNQIGKSERETHHAKY